MSEDEDKKIIDEVNIEKIIPNYGSLSTKEKKETLEVYYKKCLSTKHSNPLGYDWYKHNKDKQEERMR